MKTITLKYFTNSSEAELAKNLLAAEGVWSMIRRGDLQAYDSGSSGASLEVKEEDTDKAQEIIGD